MPFALGFLIVYLPIIYNSIVYSFTEISPSMGGGYTLRWVGFENYYEALFVDASFVSTLTEGVKQLIFDIPAIVIFSLFMAILLSRMFRQPLLSLSLLWHRLLHLSHSLKQHLSLHQCHSLLR